MCDIRELLDSQNASQVLCQLCEGADEKLKVWNCPRTHLSTSAECVCVCVCACMCVCEDMCARASVSNKVIKLVTQERPGLFISGLCCRSCLQFKPQKWPQSQRLVTNGAPQQNFVSPKGDKGRPLLLPERQKKASERRICLTNNTGACMRVPRTCFSTCLRDYFCIHSGVCVLGCAHTHIYECMCVRVCVFVCVCVCMRECWAVRTHTFMNACVCACVCVRVCVFVCVYV